MNFELSISCFNFVRSCSFVSSVFCNSNFFLSNSTRKLLYEIDGMGKIHEIYEEIRGFIHSLDT